MWGASAAAEGEPVFLDGSRAAEGDLRTVVTSLLDTLESAHRPEPFPKLSSEALGDLIGGMDPLPEDGVPLQTLLAEIGETVFANGVRTSSPYTAAHLHAPPLITAAAAELAIGVTNQSMDSFDQAPAATHVEDRLVRSLASLLGLPPGASGVLTAGGTASNLLGLLLARERATRHSHTTTGMRAWCDVATPGSALRFDPGVSVTSCGSAAGPGSALRFDPGVSVTSCGSAAGPGSALRFEPGMPMTSGGSAAGPAERDRTTIGRIVTSAAAHVSIRQAAFVLGLGRDAVVSVPTMSSGRMDIDALDGVLCEFGQNVIAIVGTAGTTDAGAIDPLDELADRAAALGCWFHVDAAVGAGLALSDRLRPRLDGLGRADSVTADLHKLWWQPISASALLVRDGSAFDGLREPADYLNRRGDDVLNLVDRSLDTSRRFDALKVLLSLRSVGRRRLGAFVEHIVALAGYAADAVRRHRDLELLCEPQTVTVLFRCRPRHMPSGELDELNTTVQRDLLAGGQAVIGRTRLEGRTALKLTLINPLVTPQDVEELIELIATKGRAA